MLKLKGKNRVRVYLLGKGKSPRGKNSLGRGLRKNVLPEGFLGE